jgi:hypothetical protein
MVQADDLDSFIVDDTGLPCTAAGVGGILVPESLEVVEICQDPDDISVIFIRLSVHGVYKYTPQVTASWEGNDLVSIDSYFIANYKGEGVTTFPIDLHCESATVLLAYRLGSVIEDFASTKVIDFNIQFMGDSSGISANPIVQGIFDSIDPTASITYVKGIDPVPFALYYDSGSGKLKVQYSNMGDVPCQCAINCLVPTDDDFGVTICQDEAQEIILDANSIVGDPTNITLTFNDTVGNSTSVDIHAMTNVSPLPPIALWQQNPTRVNISVNFETIFGTSIRPDKVSYQIWKCKNNVDNATIFKDWTSKAWTDVIDVDVVAGNSYGYAIKFKGEFGEVSNYSSWQTVEVN